MFDIKMVQISRLNYGLVFGMGLLMLGAFSGLSPISPISSVFAQSAADAQSSVVTTPGVVFMTEEEKSSRLSSSLKKKKSDISFGQADVVKKVVKAAIESVTLKKPDAEVEQMNVCKKSIANILVNEPIEFLPGRFTLKKSGVKTVKNIAGIMKDCNSVKVIVAGHTDSRGNPIANQRLSGQRANSVLRLLIKNGMKKTRLRAIGYGADKPKFPNDSPEHEAMNRRIELSLY